MLTYGCEAWRLTRAATAAINGANARLISRITGRDAHTEASPKSRTFDVILAIRKRKHEWLGHILRMGDVRLVKHAVKVQYESGDFSNMLADAPPSKSFAHLCEMARDRAKWKQTWTSRGLPPGVEIQWNDNAPSASVKILPKPKTPAPKRMSAKEKASLHKAHDALFKPKDNPRHRPAAKHKKRRKPKGLTATNNLTDKEQRVIAGYFEDGRTIKHIAEHIKVSPASVGQIKDRAINKLKKAMAC